METRRLLDQMIRYDAGTPHRIQHLIKVHAFARQIGLAQNLSEREQEVLEVAALTHDIGIRLCLEKYGSDTGKQQEEEGPALAEEMLLRLGYDRELIDRVCFLIAHHHTYDAIEGMDYQILVEADFLVNLFEHGSDAQTIRTTYENIFRTQAGREICKTMFGIA